MDQNELYHHGIKNQKWGERRYQYADGSLTPAGKKRYGTKTNYEKVLKAKGLKAKVKAQKEREKQNARTEAEVAKYKRRAGIKEEKDTTSDKPKTTKDKPHAKTLSEMTNEEIQERIDRINLENRLKALTPHQKTRGEKIIDGIKDMTMDTIKKKVVPDLTDIVIKKLKEKLGIKDNGSEMERLADAAKRAGYEKQIAEAEITKRKNDREKRQNNHQNQNQNDNSRSSNNSNESGNSSHQNNQQSDGQERYSGTVEGNGTSRRNPYESRSNNSTRRQYTDDTVDADYREFTNDNSRNEGPERYSGTVENTYRRSQSESISENSTRRRYTDDDAVDVDYQELVDDDHRIEQQNSGLPATTRRRRLRHSEIGGEFVNGLLKDDELMHAILKNINVEKDELYHHGVKKQKWGVRRYQNYDGTLTEAGRRRQQKLTASDRKATIAKGTKLYRVSDSDKSDASKDKIYVSATKESGDFYINALGSNKIRNTGKAFVHEYIATKDIKMPDKKTMEKIELGLLKDKQVQKELVDSLMKKGYSREKATEQVRPYSSGKAFVEQLGKISLGTLYGAYSGGITGTVAGAMTGNVAGIGIGGAVGAGIGAGAGATSMAKRPSIERQRALNVARVSYGDKNNKVINKTIRDELAKKGYNAMKDYNDRRAFGSKGKQAVIVFDSDSNLKSTKISEVTSKDFAKAYARNYLKEHPKSQLDFDDLVKDGEAKYKRLYESGVIEREKEKERKRLLEQAEKEKQ